MPAWAERQDRGTGVRVADIPGRRKDNDSNWRCRGKELRYAVRIVPDLVKLPATRYSL